MVLKQNKEIFLFRNPLVTLYLDSSFVLLFTEELSICVKLFCSMHFVPNVFQWEFLKR